MIVMRDRADDRRTLTRRPAVPTLEELADVLDLDALAWQDQALCSQVDSEVFFPERGQPGHAAKRVCGLCPVRAECLAYALETCQIFGIWGREVRAGARGDADGPHPGCRLSCSPT